MIDEQQYSGVVKLLGHSAAIDACRGRLIKDFPEDGEKFFARMMNLIEAYARLLPGAGMPAGNTPRSFARNGNLTPFEAKAKELWAVVMTALCSPDPIPAVPPVPSMPKKSYIELLLRLEEQITKTREARAIPAMAVQNLRRGGAVQGLKH